MRLVLIKQSNINKKNSLRSLRSIIVRKPALELAGLFKNNVKKRQ